MSEELKGCPFCGELPMPVIVDNKINYYCENRDCQFKGIDLPKNVWNTRPIEDALRKQLEAARDKFTVLKTMLSDDTTNRYYTRPLIGLIDSALAEIEKRKDNNN
jgi:hypothetical protein